ncbi:uncharacterized protein LOC106060435 isoform X2 [Biomphalaria glabrata]|uniref:Uncharacterized protein LOC106060435 isoform X2 n=1 Tax=Biomphalaria glabrata TaxID=6526 RepID=A0A9W2ZAE5_BIOGL|nr:uncharacterized protein LOC106060435 isoform X2 [Biomphalaria glabrata]
MPKPVVTSRELKNKESGIDLYVTSYSVQKGLVSNTVHYQVVLVSNLSCFKSPSHKDSDVVQYSLEKQLSEFEDLRATLAEMFPNTTLPVINKMSIIVSEPVLRERRNSLDQLLRFIVTVPKLAMSVPLLTFLGVDSIRAKKFSIGEPLDNSSAPASVETEEEENATGADNNVDFLLDRYEEEEDSELFHLEEEEQDKALFEDKGEGSTVLMFEGQDLKRELTEDDEKDFQFIPDAIIKKNVKVYESVSEDHSELFEIEDNLDQLLTVDVKKRKNKPQNGEGERSSPTRDLQQESHLTNPQTPTKPSLPRKPTLPAKPKAAGTGTTPKDSAQSGAQGKPAIPVKPKTILSSQGSVSDKETKSPGIESDNLGQDDILKYLQDNLASASEDVDLFS